MPLYWVIDPDGQFVEIWRPEDDFPAIERDAIVWHPDGAATPFTHALTELFRPI